jgi:predicted secreted acid phosphatase
MQKTLIVLLGAALLASASMAQAPSLLPVMPASEPINLNDLQTITRLDKAWFNQDAKRLADDQARVADYEKQLIAYHDCTVPASCYTTDMQKQVDLAMAYLDQRIAQRIAERKPEERLAIVLDIDETSLSNWQLDLDDKFEYVPAHWKDWYRKAQAPAIESVRKLFRKAVENKVDVFFITGRGTVDLKETEADLLAAGYTNEPNAKPTERHKGWTFLYTRADAIGTTAEYKARMRADIETGTWKERIILNLGDQLSDMQGSPMAEVSIKLPNPFYYIP